MPVVRLWTVRTPGGGKREALFPDQKHDGKAFATRMTHRRGGEQLRRAAAVKFGCAI
jgi:hypothetical protein